MTNKPSSFAPSAHNHAESDITGLLSDLASKEHSLIFSPPLSRSGNTIILNPLVDADLSSGAGIAWSKINKSGSSLSELSSRSAADLNSGILPLARLSGITSSQLSSSAGIVNGQLANSTVTINGTANRVTGGGSVSLGGTVTLNVDTTLLPQPASGDVDKTWLVTGANTTALSPIVKSFNGRTGAVVPASGDYSFAQIGGTLSGTGAAASLTSQSAAIAATNLLVAGAMAPAGVYRASIYATLTTTGTGGSVRPLVSWNDGSHSHDSAEFASLDDIDLTGAGAATYSFSIAIRTDGAHHITYSTITPSTPTGAGRYSLWVTLERLQ